MKNLWTPWRLSYILGQHQRRQGCIFEAGAEPGGGDGPAGSPTHDKANLVLSRDRLIVVLLNRFPYANGHLILAISPAPKAAPSCR